MAEGLGGARVVATVLVLALGWVVLYIDRTSLYPLLPIIGKEFSLTGAQQGAIASAYFLVYVALQTPSGLLADRFGLKRVLVVMYLVMAVGLLGMALWARSYYLLLAFVGVHAFGAGAYYSASYSITVSTVPLGRRGVATAVVTVGMACGLALGLGVSGAMAQALGSWRLPLLLMTVPTFLMVGLFYGVLRPTPVVRQPLSGLVGLLRHRDLLLLCLVSFIGMYAYWTVLSWGPSFLYRERGLSLNQAGLYTAIVALPSILGALVWGRLSDRLGRRRLILMLLPAQAGVVVAVALLRSPALLGLALAGFGLVAGLPQNPVMVSWAGDHALASGRVGLATAIGVFNAAGVGSSILAPVLSGWLLDLTGSLEWAFLLGAVTTGLAFLLALFPRETVRV